MISVKLKYHGHKPKSSDIVLMSRCILKIVVLDFLNQIAFTRVFRDRDRTIDIIILDTTAQNELKYGIHLSSTHGSEKSNKTTADYIYCFPKI